MVQVPKPLEPFDHKHDLEEEEDEFENEDSQMKLNLIKDAKHNSRTLGISLEYSPIAEVKENLE